MKFKIFKHKTRFAVCRIPSDSTWWRLFDNPLCESYIGNKINKELDLGNKLMQYGKGKDPDSPLERGIGLLSQSSQVYYDPDMMYCVQHENNPQIIGKLSEITEEEYQSISESKQKLYEELFYNDFPVEDKEYDYLIISLGKFDVKSVVRDNLRTI